PEVPLKTSRCVNDGEPASAFVLSKTPEVLPVKLSTPTSKWSGLPGSITISEIVTFPVAGESGLLSWVTTSLVNDGEDDVALVERYTPRVARVGTWPRLLAPLPPTPFPVATKIVAGSVG